MYLVLLRKHGLSGCVRPVFMAALFPAARPGSHLMSTDRWVEREDVDMYPVQCYSASKRMK